jgi:transcriptional regulator with XRE-family HTH domain
MTKYYSPTPAELRELRAKLNFTQTEMADFLMCSTNAYTKWEQGVNKMMPMVWNAMQIIVGNAEGKNKGKAKDPNAPTAEEQKYLEDMMANWDKEALELEAKNYAYRDGRPVI